MSENNPLHTNRSKRPQKSPLQERPSKILRIDDPTFENEVNKLLLESDQSDSEDNIVDCLVSEEDYIQNHESDQGEVEEDPSFVGNPTSERNSSSEYEHDSSDDNVPIAQLQQRQRRSQYYYGKNRFKWSTNPPSSRVRTAQHNIVISRPVSRLAEDERWEPFSIWDKLFDTEMRETILTWTNVKIAEIRAKFKRQERPELKELDMVELNAFLGLLYYSAVLKSNHESTSYIFATDGTGCEIFRCCMSETRFLVILRCLRFDDQANRAERQKNDKLAAISPIFEKFVTNSQKLYEVGECVTVDEMLVKFRGRSHMISYMPNKPGKYGLIVRALCDAKTFYFYNGYIYSGKSSDGIGLSEDEKKFLVPTQCVIRLTKPIQGTNRNVTADNWFSSIQLVDELSKRKLTYVGTVKKNKREIPKEFQPRKCREIQSTLFGFTKDKTLCSHVPKKIKPLS